VAVDEARTEVLSALPALLPIALVVGLALFFSRVKRSARRLQPRENGSDLEFYPVPAMDFLVKLILVLLAAFTAFTAVMVPSSGSSLGGSLAAPLIPLSVFAAILMTRPTQVVLDQRGIRQQRWFTRAEIAWNDIASVAVGQRTGTTYVSSKKGAPKIRFSAFLVGRARFVREIRSHLRDADVFQNGDAYEDG
jgi:hypothetical protein